MHVACTMPLTNSHIVLLFENFKIKSLIRKLFTDKLQYLTNQAYCRQRGWKYDDQFLSCIEGRKELMPVLAIMYK